VPAPGLYFGHVPLIVGSFVGVVLLALVTPLLLPEPPLELLVPPEEPPLLELFVPLELLVVPLELLELLVRPELEPLEPLPLCPLDVFKPTPDPLLPEDPVPASLSEPLPLLPELPETAPVELSIVDPVPPAAQPGAHAEAPTSKANMQGDSARSSRITAAP